MIPESAQRKLAALMQSTEDSKALAYAAKERASVLEAKVIQLGNAQAGGAAISKAMQQHDEASELRQQRYRHWQDTEALCTRVQAWIAELPRGTVVEPVPTPLLSVTETPAVAIATVRRQLGRAAAELHRLTIAGPNREDAKAQIRTLVQSLAVMGRPRIDVQRGEVRVSGWMGDDHGLPTAHSVTVQFMAWLAPDQMIAALEREVQTLPLDANALPHDQRRERIAELQDEIALLEHREEAVIERAATDGVVIERRHDQSPASILGVRIATAKARAA